MTKHLLFPIETINRELDYKLFLAARHSAPGRKVFIGQHNVIDQISNQLTGGIYLGKTIFKTHFPIKAEHNLLPHYRNRQVSLVHLDEEGGVYFGKADRWRQILDLRLDPNVLNSSDHLCVWGEFQQDHYAQKANLNLHPHIHVTGHPRFEICRPQYQPYFEAEISNYRKRFGDYILINGSFSIANNSFGINDTFSERMGYFHQDVPNRLKFVNRWAYIQHTMTAMVELVHELAAKHPTVHFIFRGHPNESDAYYKAIFNEIENIHVIHEGSSVPWIMGSRLIIQNNCTTGLEARLANIPMINFKPYSHISAESIIHDEMGLNLETQAEVMEEVAYILSNTISNEDWYAQRSTNATQAAQLIRNLMDYASFERLGAVLEEAIEAAPAGKTPSPNTLRSQAMQRIAFQRTKQTIYPLFPQKQRMFQSFHKMFPGFSREYVSTKLQVLGKLYGKQLVMTHFDDHLIVIEPA